ncbi:MAG: sarcosine oxidase [Alphaproteobacteria bacterium]|nr:sarcosine oxidase [Alphaproteobacteria bacterium]
MNPSPQHRRSFLAHRQAVLTAPKAIAPDGLVLVDLSARPRLGFKGRGTPAWLQGRGLALPGRPNEATPQADGGLLLRLSEHEHLLLAPLSETDGQCQALATAQARERPDHVYPLPRQDSHAWLLLAGAAAADCLAKLCAVDLRADRFGLGDMAQTLMARVSVIVARADLAEHCGYHVLCDSAVAEYLWDCLLDAMAEFGGGPLDQAAFASGLRNPEPP